MIFEIRCDDLDKAEKFLNVFVDKCREEYRKQIVKSEQKIKAYTGWLPIKTDVPLPPELVMWCQREGDRLLLKNKLPMPKILRGAFDKVMKRKMEKNLKGFFKANGLDVQTKFLGE